MDDQKAKQHRRSSTTVLSGCEDVVIEILARLPVKSLIRFRCVCTTWRSLLSTPYFINKHVKYDNQRAQNDNDIRLMFSVDPPSCVAVSDLKGAEVDSDNFMLDSVPIRKLESPDWAKHVRKVVGSCNGLICFRLADELLIWNPCTGEQNILPLPENIQFPVKYHGFGYDEVNDDYKVVQGTCSTMLMQRVCSGEEIQRMNAETVNVFSLRRGTWKTYLGPKNVYMRDTGACVNGMLHWLRFDPKRRFPGGRSKVVMRFSLAEEKFLEEAMPLPFEFFEVLVSRGSLCVSNSEHVRIMMMKEYGVQESWTELIDINHRNAFEFRGGINSVNPMWVLENGDILGWSVDISGGYMSVSSSKNTGLRHIIRIKGDFSYGKVTYRETLVSPVTGSLKDL